MGKLLDFVFGRLLSNSEEEQQRIGPLAGIPVLGLDALSSSAYGPEAAATVLLPLGVMGVAHVLPITIAIIVLLVIVYFSYRQTITAYPNGGGSYTVARENLGPFFGILAAAALLLDYVLVVAVGISAGVGALVSAVPILQPHLLSICLVTLTFITLINLRGLREAGVAFMLPTYLFTFSLLGVLGFGVIKTMMAGGHPLPVANLPHPLGSATETLSIWIIARAFASGCTAMTGVEAVSNGVKSFREPVVVHAKQTLFLIIAILILLLGGIAFLAQAYGVVATDPTAPGYESLLSQLIAAVVGRGVIYYISISSIVAVLMLSANTGFADFPRLCQILARDNYLPHAFAERGRRLVFSHGIITIAIMAGVLLFVFDGVTDQLIPLFAIGAFLAFTLSQSGMVAHWLKKAKSNHSALSIFVNGLGALATGLTLLVILVSKFTEGGWVIVALVPVLLVLFYAVRRHYIIVAQLIRSHQPLTFDETRKPVVLLPVRGWSHVTLKAMRFALNISDQIYGVYVDSGEGSAYTSEQWKKYVLDPAKTEGKVLPDLVTLPSPYRQLFNPLMGFIDELEVKHPDRQIVVLIPSLVVRKWYQYFLHNQRALLLHAALRLRADPRVITITIPWYL